MTGESPTTLSFPPGLEITANIAGIQQIWA